MKNLFVILILFANIIKASDISQLRVEVYALEALPYCGLINGRPAGIAVDILNEASNYGAPEFVFNFSIPWLRAQERIQKARGDLLTIIPFSRTESREKEYQWVAQLVTTQSRIYTIDRANALNSLNETRDLKIGVVRGHALIQRLKKLEIENIDYGALNAEANARKLLNRRVDAIAESDLIFWYSWREIAQSPSLIQEGLKIGDITGVYLAAGLNFPKGVAQSISNAIEKMEKNGRIKEIIKDWR